MISWLVGVILCLAMIVGCGGGPKGSLVKVKSTQPELTAPEPDDSRDDAALTEELSAHRLEELYAKSGIPGWDPSLEDELKKWEHQVKFDVPIQMNKQVRAYLVYFSTERKGTIRRYLARSTRYLPMIKKVFQEAGLPEDLAYLAMIESGYNCKAYSPAAASGLWQFIKGTGLRYGLVINGYVDERRDPEKATRAAAKYLLDLYKQFGSWYLAAASYNCGEGRVQRELNQSNHKNFWELSANQCLPKETKNYVPQMIAATIIAKNPDKFGFKKVPYLPPLKCDRVQVTETTSLVAAAVAVNVPPEEIQTLNPAVLRGVTPPDTPYTLNLPNKSAERFAQNITLARLEHPAVASRPIRTAKSKPRHNYSGRHHATKTHPAVARKASHKKRSYARAKTRSVKSARTRSKSRSAKRVYARKAKSRHTSSKSRGAVVRASMFGGPSLASRSGSHAKKKRVARSGGKSKSRVAKGHKSSQIRLARKQHRAKTSRSKKSSRRSKGKLSRAKKVRRAILVSEAR